MGKNDNAPLTNPKDFEILQSRVSNMESKLDLILQELQAQNTRISKLEGNNNSESNSSNLNVTELWNLYEDLQDRLYEIDKSWKNNLLFFGVKQDSCGTFESSECLENKVRSMLKNDLNIVRDIAISRAQRMYNGFDSRGGCKPVIVNFYKWSDKEEVLRKSKILKNSGIIVEEDYSRAAKIRRKELEKFARSVRSLSPEKKCIFKYDQLQIDEYIYIYNDKEGRIEKLPQSNGHDDNADNLGNNVSRNIRSRGRSMNTNAPAPSKRAQSVESFLDKVPPKVLSSGSNGRSSNMNKNLKNEK